MRSALLTDLYELTMAASYFAEGMNYPATFEMFWRELPKRRNFLIACGIDQVIEYLETFAFETSDLEFLAGLQLFSDDFLSSLGELEFSGEVWAVPEGEALFPQEPVLRVTAPLIEAQIIETYILNCVDFQTLVASKAARISIAARGRVFVDFSARRDHGADAANLAARAAVVGGAAATSNLMASRLFGIPPSGTMAHSYVMTIGDEREAFRRFARLFPSRAVLLIDTFDTLEGARAAAEVADELASEGIKVTAVRIDSGDLLSLSKRVRGILDDAGHPEIEIFVSSELDEFKIDALLAAGAPIDGFGVGTELGTGGDVAHLGGAYKLVQDSSGPKFKLSPGKETLPGIKQVFRYSDEGGTYLNDVIALEDELLEAPGRPLLQRVMTDGLRTVEPVELEALREKCRAAVEALPPRLLSLDAAEPYEVRLSPGLQGLADDLRHGVRLSGGTGG